MDCEALEMNHTPKLAEIRASLLRTPGIVSQMTAALPQDVLVFRESPESWNIFEVLRHLGAGEVHDWIPRVRIILAGGPEPRFTPFDREAGATRYQGWSAAQVLADFERLRQDSIQQLDGFNITSDKLDLTGIHPEFGRVPLRQLLACWATHDYAHIAQISRILVRYYGEHVGPWTEYFSLLRDHPNS
jgi:hypothetical protein